MMNFLIFGGNSLIEFSDLVHRLKAIPLQERREESSDYLEVVVAVEDLTRIYPILELYFGPPFKPAGVKPSKEANSKAADLGGIQTQQTLYYIEKNEQSSCAMIWPWQDKLRATLKVAQGEIAV